MGNGGVNAVIKPFSNLFIYFFFLVIVVKEVEEIPIEDEPTEEEVQEESSEGGDEEGGDEEEDEDDDDEEDEDEEDPEDPYETNRTRCAETKECADLMAIFEQCEERVNSKSQTEETCSQEILDFFHCQDHCAAKGVFAKLK